MISSDHHCKSGREIRLLLQRLSLAFDRFLLTGQGLDKDWTSRRQIARFNHEGPAKATRDEGFEESMRAENPVDHCKSRCAVNPLQQPKGEQHPDQVGEQHLGVAEHRQHFQGGDRQVVGHAAAADGNAWSLH